MHLIDSQKIILSLLFSTISAGYANAQPLNTAIFKTPPAKRVTKKGKNRQPIFVSNSIFVYVSEGRKAHKDPQLYFKDLRDNKEKRITHQRGQLSNGVFNEKVGKIFYSSSTDEEKETPLALQKYLNRFPASVSNDQFFQIDFVPSEIYASRIDGTEIERLTQYSGYDGFPVYDQQKNQIYFSRWQNQRLNLYAQSLSKNMAPWKLTSTQGHDLGLQISPDQKSLLWSRFSPDFKSSQVVVSDSGFKNIRFLTLESGINWSPVWHPNGQSVIYSSKSGKGTNFDLFEVSLNGDCKRQITGYNGDEFFPAISDDGRTLLFTSTQSGNEQIYKLKYPGTFSCK